MRKNGFTMIETIVALGVLSIFFAAVAFILQQILESVGVSRVRAVALTLGQEKMEMVRNLPYDSVGTVGGIPAGPILQTENITINNTVFTVITSILYIDDPFDGLAPTDPIPADYKRVRVQITWGGAYPSRVPVTLVTNIVPKGIESNPGGGTLYIQVLDAQGLPVSNASVTVTNTLVTPQINLTTLTNANGNVTIPAAPACVSCYNISVTKSGYSTDRTYTTSEVTNPLQPPTTVLQGQVTQVSFAIDTIGSLSINSVGTQQSGYPTVPNVIFVLRGSKIIGYDTLDNPVYKYTFSTNTGGGTVGIPNLEWDNYTVDLSSSNYTLSGSTPLNPVTVLPSAAVSMTIVVEPHYNSSLLLTVKNSLGQLMGGATATASSQSLGVTVTKNTAVSGSPDFGQAFFNNLAPATYQLSASISGYLEATGSVTISTNQQSTLVVN